MPCYVYYTGLNTLTVHVFGQLSELSINSKIYVCTHVTTFANRYIPSQATLLIKAI